MEWNNGILSSKCGRKYRDILYMFFLFSKLAARMGAYFHGVLIDTCNILVAHSCVGTD